jgi:hypothetical protein
MWCLGLHAGMLDIIFIDFMNMFGSYEILDRHEMSYIVHLNLGLLG